MSIYEIGAGVKHSRDLTEASVQNLVEGADRLEEALSTIVALTETTQDPEIIQAARSFTEAQQRLGEIAAMLAGLPNVINPWLESIGAGSVAGIGVPDRIHVPMEDPNKYRRDADVLAQDAGEPSDSLERNAVSPESQSYYRDRVAEIDRRIADGANPKEIEGFIAKGGYCYVYKDVYDGRDVVIKLPRVLVEHEYEDENGVDCYEDVLPPAGTVDKGYREPLERGRGIPGLEQIVTTIDDGGRDGGGAIICERIPGKVWDKMTNEEQCEIPAEHYDRLLESLVRMGEQNLVVDNDPDNIMYDSSVGFTILDYSTKEYREEQLGTAQLSDGASQATWVAGKHGALNENTDHPVHKANLLDAIKRRFGDSVAREVEKSRLRMY